jgi:peroxiredoxin
MQVGSEIPAATVAVLDSGIPTPFDIRDIIEGHRCLLIGVPRAFSPVCAGARVLEVAAEIDRYKAEGVERFIVVMADHPWAMEAWRRELDVPDEILFVSDGNLNFAKAGGLLQRWRGLFLGDCSKRFLIRTKGLTVTTLEIEDPIHAVNGSSRAPVYDIVTESGVGCDLEFIDA